MNNNTMDMTNAYENGLNTYIAKVFGWMFLGLMVTALTTAFFVIGSINNQFIFNITVTMLELIFPIIILELILVFYLANKIETMKPTLAKAIYLIYAMLNGITVGLLSLLVYTGSAVAVAFMLTAISFGTMSIYGLVTKTDLTKMGNILSMGLVGLIVIMIFNFFIGSEPLDFLISIFGLFIFLGLTVRDTNKIKQYYYALDKDTDSDIAQNVAILGALALYLDFINIFMFVLRILSKKKR